MLTCTEQIPACGAGAGGGTAARDAGAGCAGLCVGADGCAGVVIVLVLLVPVLLAMVHGAGGGAGRACWWWWWSSCWCWWFCRCWLVLLVLVGVVVALLVR